MGKAVARGQHLGARRGGDPFRGILPKVPRLASVEGV